MTKLITSVSKKTILLNTEHINHIRDAITIHYRHDNVQFPIPHSPSVLVTSVLRSIIFSHLALTDKNPARYGVVRVFILGSEGSRAAPECEATDSMLDIPAWPVR